MTPLGAVRGPAFPLPLENVDTDQLIPARFMKRTRAEGYGDALLHDVPLDRDRLRAAPILVARRNFGCGSSREAAVYALFDAGIRCVLAPSFGDIFAANAVNNGLLPARLSEADAETLLRAAADTAFVVDLERCTVEAGPHRLPFAVDPVARQKLLEGWDDLDLTASHAPAIAAFAARDRADRPWAYLT